MITEQVEPLAQACASVHTESPPPVGNLFLNRNSKQIHHFTHHQEDNRNGHY